MTQKNNFDITTLASNDACFDLQFRKDTRHKRTNSPTYYRWKVQFVITGPKESANTMSRVKRTLGCGNVHVLHNQVRFSVQNIEHIAELVVPFFTKNKLMGNKKKEFELWKKAVSIIHRNKGKFLTVWEKNDLFSLIEIHKLSSRYKKNPRKPKWIDNARLT